MSDLSQRIANLSAEKRTLLETSLLREKSAAPPVPAISRRLATGPAPLSYAQRRLWFLDQLDPGQALYNIHEAIRISGPLDSAALEDALSRVVARHEALRTCFVVSDGQPFAQVEEVSVVLPKADLSELSPDSREAEVRHLAEEQQREPFDLSRAPLIRMRLLRLAPSEHVLLLTMHHIASDGWSVGLLMGEIAHFYGRYGRYGREETGEPAELPIQYSDYAAWQREWLKGEVEERQLAYWKGKLSGDLVVLELPLDRERPAARTYAGAQERRLIGLELTEGLERLARREGATLFMVLVGAFQVLLSRLTGQEDVLVGTPIAGRNRVETESLIGFFVNTLVLRGDLSGDPTFREYLGRVRETALEAFTHQDLPFERLVEELRPERDLAHSPLFQVMFALENYGLAYPEIEGLALKGVEIDTAVSKFDLTLDMVRTEKGLQASAEYKTDLLDRRTVRKWLEGLERLLEGIVKDPERRVSELPILTEGDRRLLAEWNATRAPFPREQTLHRLIEEQVDRTPDAVAVEMEGRTLTYGQLDREASRLARYLRGHGVGPEVLVGICLERSLDMVVALFGVLKAGGAYVPLDPVYPKDRLKFFLEDSGASVLVTRGGQEEGIGKGAWRVVSLDREKEAIEGCPMERFEGSALAENLAYVIYTSGSTGQPKGVMIEHRSLVNFVTAAAKFYGLGGKDRVLQFASLSFDTAAEEIYPTLVSGATLILRTDEMTATARGFLELSRQWGLTVLDLPTSYWHELSNEMALRGLKVPETVRLAVIGGEAALPQRLVDWQRAVGGRVRLVNSYGPTEATVVATHCDLEAPRQPALPQAIPIGRPIANARVYVFDGKGQPVPIGVPGELCIGGEGVARGYWNRPSLTLEKFVPDPFAADPGGRLYRTGDRARFRADGALEFLGRLDGQIKIRGYRIELGEIEAALSRHPELKEAAVVAREDEPGQKRLVAYVAPHALPGPSTTDLRRFLETTLPAYMLPSLFAAFPELPKLPNGKVDRRKLPDPGASGSVGGEAFIGPRTPIEEAIAGIWSDLLGVKPVGITENFFDLGGHSLLATRVIARLRDTFSIDIPLRALFESPTVGELALAVAQVQARLAAPEGLERLLEELEREASQLPSQGKNGG